MKKRVGILMVIIGAFYANAAKAVCPVCTVAVCAGLGLSRWLGIDDSISGLWIGGLTVSMIIWTLNWFEKKEIRFKFRGAATATAYYVLIFAPLYAYDIVGDPKNILCGIDKVFLGAVIGSLSFYGFAEWYKILKKKNGDKAYFPFQKVAMPISPLVIFSIIFYFLTK